MKITRSICSILSIAMLLSACNSIDFKKTKGGVPYKLIPSKSGDKIAQGNFVKYQYILKVKDSVVTSTYDRMPDYREVSASTGTYDIGSAVMEIFSKAKKGDSAYLVMSMDTLIAHDPMIVQQTPFRKGDQLKMSLKILEVFKSPDQAQADAMKERAANAGKMEQEEMKSFQNNPQVKEQLAKDNKAIEDYLAANHIQTQKTPWGVYVQILTPGQGPKPTVGQFASLRYRGAHMSGEEFDANMKPTDPLLPLQIGAGRSIIGFEDGVKNLQKGSKARLFIPSVLAYGPNGRAPKIQPNENLIFDIELVDVSDNPPVQKPVMPGNIDTTKAHK